MLKFYNEKKRLKSTAHQIYGSIVTQARAPLFYAAWGIPDSVEGRFEMIVVHMALVMRRLKDGDEKAFALSRLIAERFVEDMDDSLREMGVGDLAVPKKMRKAGEAFNGRLRAYADALDGGDTIGLCAVLSRNIAEGADHENGFDAAALADYMQRSADVLAKLPMKDIGAGDVRFADPGDGGGGGTVNIPGEAGK